jgi:hypothetical protein
LSIYDLIWSFSEAMIAKQLKSKGKKGVWLCWITTKK